MDEISVQHIGSLYDYCHSAERFLNDVESAINQMKSDLGATNPKWMTLRRR